jgi:hypothetical protein
MYGNDINIRIFSFAIGQAISFTTENFLDYLNQLEKEVKKYES